MPVRSRINIICDQIKEIELLKKENEELKKKLFELIETLNKLV